MLYDEWSQEKKRASSTYLFCFFFTPLSHFCSTNHDQQVGQLPPEILAQILEVVNKEENVNAEASKIQQWAMVKKKSYHCYQSFKYKEITITLDGSSVMFNNIVRSKFKNRVYVRSVTFADLCSKENTNNLSVDGDPLSLLMTRCTKVKYVILPKHMDEDDWTYF